MTPPIALTIAAHDPLGGAGIAADLTTFAAHDVHGMVALTAVSAQGFASLRRVDPVSAGLLADQLDALLDEVRVDALKVGLLTDAAQVAVIAERIGRGLPAPVVDPVMVDGAGSRFVRDDVEAALRGELFPRARVLTPNRAEAVLLAGAPSGSTPDPAVLAGLGAELVIVTGGGADAVDVTVTADGRVGRLDGAWVDTGNVRGSGCTFAAAVTAGLALGRSPLDAAAEAKAFVAARLRDSAAWTVAPAGARGPVSHRCGPAVADGQGTSAHASP